MNSEAAAAGSEFRGRRGGQSIQRPPRTRLNSTPSGRRLFPKLPPAAERQPATRPTRAPLAGRRIGQAAKPLPTGGRSLPKRHCDRAAAALPGLRPDAASALASAGRRGAGGATPAAIAGENCGCPPAAGLSRSPFPDPPGGRRPGFRPVGTFVRPADAAPGRRRSAPAGERSLVRFSGMAAGEGFGQARRRPLPARRSPGKPAAGRSLEPSPPPPLPPAGGLLRSRPPDAPPMETRGRRGRRLFSKNFESVAAAARL